MQDLKLPFFGCPEEWNDWRWQIRNRVTTPKRLKQFLSLGPAEEEIFSGGGVMFPFSITPYFLSVLAAAGGEELRKTVIPRREELCVSSGDKIDPLSEHADTVAPGLVHRYPDRVLFLVTDFCSTYCRYCTRSRIVGKPSAGLHRKSRWEDVLKYIEEHTEVRDVLLSGGDPLTLEDHELEWLLSRLSSISHVEMIRIGTKVPVVLPMRITPRLTRMLKQYHPLWMSIHFSHPSELTPETQEACRLLADAGIPLGSQTVLLRGVNDSAPVLTSLFHGLLKIRVRPYYLYQCDPVVGASHFRTSVEEGLRLIEEVRGFTSGYAVPAYVVDAPGGGGKIPLLTDHIVGREDGSLLLSNYMKDIFRYPDPEGNIQNCSLREVWK
jgi:lysine 2,3-aminomutase